MRVELASLVVDFVRSLAPDPRKKLRSALHDLEQGKGDIKPLTHELQGFYPLRIGAYRVIFHKVVTNSPQSSAATSPKTAPSSIKDSNRANDSLTY